MMMADDGPRKRQLLTAAAVALGGAMDAGRYRRGGLRDNQDGGDWN